MEEWLKDNGHYKPCEPIDVGCVSKIKQEMVFEIDMLTGKPKCVSIWQSCAKHSNTPIFRRNIMKEDFKAIKGFDNYLIGNKGTVLNINPYHKTLANEEGNVVIHGKLDKDGYRTVGLYNNDKKRKHVRVHRLVAEAFCDNPNPEDYNIVNHKNGDKQDNRAINLEWCDVSQNTKHAYEKLGRKPTRICKQIAKINKDTGAVLQIYESAVEAGIDNSVSRTAISSCTIKRSKGIKATSCGYIWEYLNEGQTTIENT